MHRITLGHYKDLKFAAPPQYTEQELDKVVIESVLKSAHVWSKTQVPVEGGDKVSIRVEATLDGMIVPELCTSNLTYTVGDANMLQQFESVIGKKHGETFTMDIMFDERMPIERIHNKNIHFEATILDVVHTREVTIDDDFARKYDPTCTGLKELKQKFVAIITNNADEDIREKTIQEILKVILTGTHINFDPNLFEQDFQMILQQAKLSIQNSVIPDFDKISQGLDEDMDLVEDCRNMTTQLISENLIVNEVARLENIALDPQEVIDQIGFYSGNEASTLEFRKHFPTDDLFEKYLLREKVMDKLLEWNL